jgi:hypothetical protein
LIPLVGVATVPAVDCSTEDLILASLRVYFRFTGG